MNSMKKQLNLVINKLNKHPLVSLSIEELRLYFDYRLENLIKDKKVLTRNELDYLLSETGPGNRRIDPQIISEMVHDNIFTCPPYSSLPEFQQLAERKEELEEYIANQKTSDETNKLIVEILAEYTTSIKIIENNPLTVETNLNNIPITFLIKNGDWIIPNTELFIFLKDCQEQKRMPIIIAKKIAGILFPVFKNISILGLNLYKTYLPEKAEELIKNASYKPEENFISAIKYNGQFQILNAEYVHGINDEHWEGYQFKNFFENVLPKNIETYYGNFLNSKIKIADNFLGTVSQFRKNKASKGLMQSYETQESLIKKLASVPKDDIIKSTNK